MWWCYHLIWNRSNQRRQFLQTGWFIKHFEGDSEYHDRMLWCGIDLTKKGNSLKQDDLHIILKHFLRRFWISWQNDVIQYTSNQKKAIQQSRMIYISFWSIFQGDLESDDSMPWCGKNLTKKGNSLIYISFWSIFQGDLESDDSMS